MPDVVQSTPMVPPHDSELNELGRRLAAAFASHMVRHDSLDQVLSQTPETAGTFWTDLARVLLDSLTLEALHQINLPTEVSANKHVH